jgi:Spy/CpxP family protein refolding chaperone
VKSNSSLLMVSTVALVPPTLSFAILLVVIPYSVESLQPIPNDPNFSSLLLSLDQHKELQEIQSAVKPQILAVLNPSQQAQLETKLMQGQSFWQGIASLDLSKTQQATVRTIMKAQRLKMFKLLTPRQRRQLGRSLPTQLLQ